MYVYASKYDLDSSSTGANNDRRLTTHSFLMSKVEAASFAATPGDLVSSTLRFVHKCEVLISGNRERSYWIISATVVTQIRLKSSHETAL